MFSTKRLASLVPSIVVALLLLVQLALGSATQVKITNDPATSPNANQLNPAAHEGRIVWVDDRNGNEDIYMWDSLEATESAIVTNTANQWTPDIGERWVVWSDLRNPRGIYGRDLTSGEESLVSASPAGTDFIAPRVSGDRVVWQSYANMDVALVRAKDLSTGIESTVSGEQIGAWWPEIDGDLVVWREHTAGGNSDIWAKNLATGEVTVVAEGPQPQSMPRVRGDLVAWAQDGLLPGDASSLWTKNMSTGEIRNITPTSFASNTLWTLGENRVAWSTTSTCLYVRDLSSMNTREISATLPFAYPPYPYELDGSWVYWEDSREGDKDIFGADITFLPLHSDVLVDSYASQHSNSRSFKVGWSSTPSVESSWTGFGVRYKVGSEGSWRSWLEPTLETSSTFIGSCGHTYYLQCRVTDGEGGTSDWSDVRGCVVPYDHGSIRFSRYWYTARASSMYGRAARYSASRGASASLYATGARSIGVLVTRRSTGGYAYVYINGRLTKKITCYYPTTRYRDIMPIASYASPRNVSVKVVVAGSKPSRSRGYRVEIDGIAVRR